MGSRDAQGNNTGAGLGLRPEGESFWGGIFGGKAGGNGTKSGFGVDAGFMNLLG
jgi:hypothetical protein